MTPIEVAQAHAIDDLAREVDATRRLRRESALMLADALHALQNGRLAVAEEFIERLAQRWQE